jgi:hypothetical protein
MVRRQQTRLKLEAGTLELLEPVKLTPRVPEARASAPAM